MLARRKSRQYIAAEPSDATPWDTIKAPPAGGRDELQQAHRYWRGAFAYAQQLYQVIDVVNKEENRLIKEEYGNDPVAYKQARQVSREHNLKRYAVSVFPLVVRCLSGRCPNDCVDGHWIRGREPPHLCRRGPRDGEALSR